MDAGAGGGDDEAVGFDGPDVGRDRQLSMQVMGKGVDQTII